ncbi:YraN family protein [Patescibacteria group bacterium]|nr:YraN family protein [Patescibacteria group bacterium]
MFYKKQFGQRGEKIALKYYQSKGYKYIAQNFYTRYGEIDLILQKNQQMLIVEVKTRSSLNFGWGEESINNKKINNIQKAYQIFCQRYKTEANYKIEICIVEIINGQNKIRTFEI